LPSIPKEIPNAFVSARVERSKSAANGSSCICEPSHGDICSHNIYGYFRFARLGAGAGWEQDVWPTPCRRRSLKTPTASYLSGIAWCDSALQEKRDLASTDPGKLGKKSSCADLHVVDKGIPVMEMKGESTTVLERLLNSSGHTVGLIVVGFDFTEGQESQAAKLGKETAKNWLSKYLRKVNCSKPASEYLLDECKQVAD
jgi:hypothetical protein